MSFTKLLRTTVAILVIFFCIQGFNVLLSASSLDEQITSSVLSGYRSVANQLVNTIERGLRFGKPLDGFAGMDSYMSNTTETIQGIPQLAVFDTEGTVLYTAHELSDETTLQQAFQAYAETTLTDAAPPSRWIEQASSYYDFHPLIGFKGQLQGYLALQIKQQVIEDARDAFLHVNILIVISLALAVGIAQTGWLTFILSSVGRQDPAKLRRSIRWLLLFIIGGAQLLYSIPTLSFFEKEIDRSTEYKAILVGAPLARDLEFLVQKHVDFGKAKGIEAELARITEENPEISGAQLDYRGTIVAAYGEEPKEKGLVTVPIYESWPNRYTPRRMVGQLTMVRDRSFVNTRLYKLALDLGTTLVICLLLLGELASLFAMFAGFRSAKEEPVQAKATPGQALQDRALLIRGMCFLFFFGYDMVLTFIPLAARDLGGTLFGLSPTVLSSLPISAEMTMAGAGIFLVGYLSRTITWNRLFLAGILCASLGGFLAAMAPTISLFILARGVAGLGFGLILMSGQLGLLHQENRAEGLGNMFAGVFAGSLCGCATGAMLSEHFSYSSVFLAAGVLIPLTLTLLPYAGSGTLQDAARAKRKLAPLLGFLREPRLWALLLMVSIPAAACLSGFLYFIVPVQMQRLAVPQGDVGRLFMLYGLCFIYAGPLIGKIVDRATNTTWYVVLAGVLSGLALMLASIVPTFWGYAASVLCTGIAQCIVASSLLVYVLTLPSVKELGTDKAASMFRLIERGGQVLGPVVFAAMAAAASLGGNLLMTGSAFVLMGLLFAGVALRNKQPQEPRI